MSCPFKPPSFSSVSFVSSVSSRIHPGFIPDFLVLLHLRASAPGRSLLASEDGDSGEVGSSLEQLTVALPTGLPLPQHAIIQDHSRSSLHLSSCPLPSDQPMVRLRRRLGLLGACQAAELRTGEME